MKTIYWVAGLAAAGIGGYLIYNYLVSSNQIPPIGGSNGVPLFSNPSPTIGFGSGGSGGGIGGTPSDIYDYTITPSNNSSNLSPIQAFKQNYSFLGAVQVVSSPLAASNIPIGYNQSINDISTNSKTTSITKTVYNTTNGLAPFIKTSQNGMVFSTNIFGAKPTSGLVSKNTSFPTMAQLSNPLLLNNYFQSIKSSSSAYSGIPSVVKSINISTPAIQLQNSSIFPVSNYTGGSPSNSYLINNGKAYAGYFNSSSGLGAYNVSLNNSKIYQLSNVSNASALLTAGNLSLSNEYAALGSMNYSQLYKLTNSVSNITNASSNASTPSNASISSDVTATNSSNSSNPFNLSYLNYLGTLTNTTSSTSTSMPKFT